MINFILNNTEIISQENPNGTLLDFIRYRKQLTGTKSGCREGDCGACNVVVGDLVGDKVQYLSLTSCLTPLGNVQGKHVVTIEGINKVEGLTKIQQAMSDEAATQCGFCTIGFEMSLLSYALNYSEKQSDSISAIDGNICRCTGYKSIERAALSIENNLKKIDQNSLLEYLVDEEYVPSYFKTIPLRLENILSQNISAENKKSSSIIVAGGTDLGSH